MSSIFTEAQIERISSMQPGDESYWLGRVKCDFELEKSQQIIARSIDEVALIFGIDPLAWRKALRSVNVNQSDLDSAGVECIATARRDISLGNYFIEAAYDALPIEDNDEDNPYSSGRLVLQGEKGTIELHHHGQWWNEQDPEEYEDTDVGFEYTAMFRVIALKDYS